MRKKTKIIIALAVACAGTLVLGACADSGPYSDLKKDGNSVQIRYEANGGRFDSRTSASVVNVYNLDDVKKGITIYAPNDKEHVGKEASTLSRGGYFLAGWYSVREPRVNENGDPLDEEGNICNIETPVLDEEGEPVLDVNGVAETVLLSATGKEQGYVYSNRWNFEENAKLTLDNLEKVDDDEYTLTLYAAWVPEFTYRINMMDEKTGEWQVVATKSINPINNPEFKEIAVPEWNENTGKMDYGEFPSASLERESGSVDLTFLAVYADETKNQSLTAITHPTVYNKENGTAIEADLYKDYYADYREGLWFRIHTAKQLADNARADGCYEILEDLDFGGDDTTVNWGPAFTGTFSGTLIGVDADGNEATRKISNVSVRNTDTRSSYGGIFGRIAASARIENINFENATFHLQKGSTQSTAQFGLFAGELNASATIRNVTISGTFVFGLNTNKDQVFDTFATPNKDTSFGILTGNYVTTGINEGDKYGNIEVKSIREGLEVTCEEDQDDGTLTGHIIVDAKGQA